MHDYEALKDNVFNILSYFSVNNPSALNKRYMHV